jgi:hypothetical protein
MALLRIQLKGLSKMDVLAGIFAPALVQDLSYTSKTVLVSRGRRRLAVAADVTAMLTSSLYLILAASVTVRSGLSFATVEALCGHRDRWIVRVDRGNFRGRVV